jgi:hypothetical protein
LAFFFVISASRSANLSGHFLAHGMCIPPTPMRIL